MKNKKVIIIGAGPGGLATGLLLSSKGYDVTIYEKKPYVGGRNSSFKLGEYTFDLGPTFFLMPKILEDIFIESGERLDEHLNLIEINPMYRLKFYGLDDFNPYSHSKKFLMYGEMEKIFPYSSKAYDDYIRDEEKKFSKLEPCLKVPYLSLSDYLKPNFLRALPYLDAHKSIYDVLGSYYKENELKLAFTFQAKYIGMSPWIAPGTFSIISYLEHKYGIFHIEGGLNQASKLMKELIEKRGGKVVLNTSVKEILFDNKKVAKGIILENNEKIEGDYIVINADFATAMKNLVPENLRKKYSNKNLENKRYSCSTFMLYLGVDKIYKNIPHHSVIFAKDYRKNVKKISENKDVGGDFSFYVQNPSVTDSTLAPKGKSSVYVLVPVANNKSNIDWEIEKDDFTQLVLDKLEKIGEFKGIRDHIEELKVITPNNWEIDYDVYKGAVFNLSHDVMQMLWFRPHNELEGYKNLFLVGGGTHPGSGLPTIYGSAKIAADLIETKDK
ncbi:phytoene desaturase family protein [Cetobacterium sp. NK01]|uniref:phytoene desaturase family protein n=1 Tax=Cetobacterium sp. NK01 TaxID=2993530 RepID=UPI0029E829B2|nr:phytoene desaturase family protein [Cetobacterium sp. NK01]